MAKIKKEIEDRRKEEKKKKSAKKRRKSSKSHDSDIASDKESNEFKAMRTLKEANELILKITNIIHHHMCKANSSSKYTIAFTDLATNLLDVDCQKDQGLNG